MRTACWSHFSPVSQLCRSACKDRTTRIFPTPFHPPRPDALTHTAWLGTHACIPSWAARATVDKAYSFARLHTIGCWSKTIGTTPHCTGVLDRSPAKLFSPRRSHRSPAGADSATLVRPLNGLTPIGQTRCAVRFPLATRWLAWPNRSVARSRLLEQSPGHKQPRKLNNIGRRTDTNSHRLHHTSLN